MRPHTLKLTIAAVGVADCLIVDTPDALLVADKSATQEVRKVVERLRTEGHEEYRVHRKVHRPWGALRRRLRALRT